MQRDDFVQPLHRTVLNHRRRAADSVFIEHLFARLKQQPDASAPVRAVGVEFLLEQPGCAQQHRRVAVVAAGVHQSVVLRAEFVRCFFLDRQGIHVCANADHRPVRRSEFRHHPGPPDSGSHIREPDFPQGFRNDA